MTIRRRVAATVFVASAWAFLATSGDPLLAGPPQCGQIPQPRCSQGCPDDGQCYLDDYQNFLGQQGAQYDCQVWQALYGCDGSVSAEPDGTCFWVCQYEGPAPEPDGR